MKLKRNNMNKKLPTHLIDPIDTPNEIWEEKGKYIVQVLELDIN